MTDTATARTRKLDAMGAGGKAPLDRARVIGLEAILGMELSDIVDTLVRSVAAEIENVDRALAAGRPQDAVHPAHRARNDGLLIGAEPLLAALIDVETAGARGDLELAREALERVRVAWPAAREELQRCAGGR
jgi:hypothetical protein